MIPEALHAGLLLTAFGFGFRHGIDWDHIAAISDITGSQQNPRRSMTLATLYAVGHAVVVFALGLGAIVLADRLPASVDATMERFVGATLVLLGLYVFVALLRQGRDFRMRSRWMLLISGMRRAFRWLHRWTTTRRREDPVVEVVHEHEHAVEEHHHEHAHQRAPVASAPAGRGSAPHSHLHRHLGRMPDDPFATYTGAAAFGIGMLHGVGAETPTQVLIFLAAAGAGGKLAGVALLVCFIVGLLASNTVVALAGTLWSFGTRRNFALYATVSAVTAVGSLVIGTLFLFGQGASLPALFGG
jgi:ABC-type nickel/cobalt efflux system permease component RcnA